MNKISIALCTFNGEAYLPQQLDSFISQERQPDEVIICDDRSSDRTHEIVNNFIKKAPFKVKFIVNDNNLGITKIDSKACVESVFTAMSSALAKGDRIEIRGFATFKLKEYSPYTGRNPKSGELIDVDGKRLPYFKMCKELKQRVNR